MVFNTGAALLDAIVLAVVSRENEGTYGYKITQDVRKVLDVSESTLYPVLRRLQKNAYLEVYDRQFDGRNRRYYKVTDQGIVQLEKYRVEWKEYAKKISDIFEGGVKAMTRNEYLTRLAELLQDIPAEERVAAMEYYNDYFDDAGGENEQQVIRELGSPEQVAAEVKAGLGKTESKNEEASHTETYRDPVNNDRQTSYSYGNNPQYRNGNPMPETKESWISNGWKIALVVLLVIILIPVGGPLVVSVIGILFGLIVAAFFIFIALVIVAICLVIVGVILAGNGILAIGTSFAAACVIIGIGLILAAIGCAATVGTIWLCTIVLPVMYHFIVNLCRKPFQKKGGAA